MTDIATYRDWLGDAHNDLNEGVIKAFTDAANAYYAQEHIAQRDPEDAIANSAEDDHALSAILQALLHEDNLPAVAHRTREAEKVLQGWIRAQAALGTPETTIAQQSGLARDTVRKRLGK